MNEEFVSFDLAKKLKEKGFEWDCYTTFDGVGYTTHFCPTISQVLKWLRDEKKIFVAINISWCYEDEEHPFYEVKEPIFKGYYSSAYLLKDLAKQDIRRNGYYDSFEQAALAGIEYALDNVI